MSVTSSGINTASAPEASAAFSANWFFRISASIRPSCPVGTVRSSYTVFSASFDALMPKRPRAPMAITSTASAPISPINRVETLRSFMGNPRGCSLGRRRWFGRRPAVVRHDPSSDERALPHRLGSFLRTRAGRLQPAIGNGVSVAWGFGADDGGAARG